MMTMIDALSKLDQILFERKCERKWLIMDGEEENFDRIMELTEEINQLERRIKRAKHLGRFYH